MSSNAELQVLVQKQDTLLQASDDLDTKLLALEDTSEEDAIVMPSMSVAVWQKQLPSKPGEVSPRELSLTSTL
ncbi:hypothetical protein XM38_048580 [Halomicronema hongdechloris C2206]|uniref:Uncharacterized protein n=1 Tax=Halomicronema hongdechloris C2206 TaxID=1641165 RepID=A0A1Z3HUA2_9CYAN|nr:hypothetical protein [Halomicronema hongdechloris]ASC73884.1 hypothetical protein XM38_048580 [Halomicronema hongdechloris C2206]